MELRVARAATSKVGGAAHAGCTLPGYHDDSEGANGDESTGVCVQLPIFGHATYFYWHKKRAKKEMNYRGLTAVCNHLVHYSGMELIR